MEHKENTNPKLYSAKEVIEILGVSRPTLLREINNGNLKAFKAGRQWRITEEALNEYMKPEKI